MASLHEIRHSREPAILRLHRLLKCQILEIERLAFALHFPHLIDVLLPDVTNGLPTATIASVGKSVDSRSDEAAYRPGRAGDLGSDLQQPSTTTRRSFRLYNSVREPTGSTRNSRRLKGWMGGVSGTKA